MSAKNKVFEMIKESMKDKVSKFDKNEMELMPELPPENQK